MVSISTILDRCVFQAIPDWQSTVSPILATFAADGVAQVPVSTMMSDSGVVEMRTLRRGDQFLQFIAEGDSSDI